MEEHMQANGNAAENIDQRLAALGLKLPTPPSPLGSYVAASATGNLLFISGMLPLVDGKLILTGRLGANLTIAQGQEATRYAALNALAVASHFLGDVNRVRKVVRLGVAMVTTEDFMQHAKVGDGASKLFAQIFGPDLGHTRLVYGMYSLPLGSPVVLDVIFEIIV
jgi:enamine deaminase RidA (YjgF/YER057c/UK114 family)